MRKHDCLPKSRVARCISERIQTTHTGLPVHQARRFGNWRAARLRFSTDTGIRLWHSMPWNLSGGMHLIESVQLNPEALITSIETEAAKKGWCEIRWTLSPEHTATYGDAFTKSGYERTNHFTHLLKTNEDVDTLWHAYNKRVRGAVRKAEKSGVEVTDTDSEAALSTFYDMYLMTVKQLGGTPKPRVLMQTLLQRKIAKLAIATYRDTIIAGLLYLRFNRTVTLWCEASVPAFLKYRPNNAIFHYIITQACHEKDEWVDFGASPSENTGLIAHKEQYRATRTDFASYTKGRFTFEKEHCGPGVKAHSAKFIRGCSKTGLNHLTIQRNNNGNHP